MRTNRIIINVEREGHVYEHAVALFSDLTEQATHEELRKGLRAECNRLVEKLVESVVKRAAKDEFCIAINRDGKRYGYLFFAPGGREQGADAILHLLVGKRILYVQKQNYNGQLHLPGVGYICDPKAWDWAKENGVEYFVGQAEDPPRACIIKAEDLSTPLTMPNGTKYVMSPRAYVLNCGPYTFEPPQAQKFEEA